MKTMAHYIRRARELGTLGTLRRAQERIVQASCLSSRALWSDLSARREMTDRKLLARTNGGWRTVDALLEHFANRPGPSFLLPYESPESVVQLLRQDYPQYCSAVLSAADAVCRGKFDVLGQQVKYGAEVDWHRDPFTRWRWPLLYRERFNQYLWSSDPPADPILIWELNRHQHFAHLGVAYWLTNDSRYVQAFVEQLLSWIKANPPQHGIHWYYSLEVAVRLVAWTLGFQFFRRAPAFRQRAGALFFKSLWQQADFISKHFQLAWSTVPNNHLIAEATALVLLGGAFPEFKEAAAWRDTGLGILGEHIPIQTHLDGVNKEQATCYHRFITELLILVVAQGRRGLLRRLPILEDTLARMLDYVLYTLTPAGTVPMWGDSDYARALGMRSYEDYWNWRPLLAAGGALFHRADYKFMAGRYDEEPLWLLGADGLAAWESLEAHPPEQTSRAFPDAGLYAIRDTWDPDSDAAFFRCGPFGLGGAGQCVHSHCDILSVQLWNGGRPLLVDSGTYTYSGPWRNPFRLTAAHNTVMIDGHEQAMPRKHFGWQSVPQAQCLAWDGQRVVGAMQVTPDVRHRREVNHPEAGLWEVTDNLAGDGVHDVSWFFHFAPGLSLCRVDTTESILVQEHGTPFVLVIPPVGVQVDLGSGWYSSRYGIKEPNPELIATWRGDIPSDGVNFGWKFQLIVKD
jgi:hypothetical protein